MSIDDPFELDDMPPLTTSQRAQAAMQNQARPAQEATPWLDGLNDAQREAIERTEGPLLVLAGAGTGKTRVLTSRLAHILSRGLAYPSQILCVTFTNKAAREMRERVEAVVGGEVEGLPWLGTFHAVANKMLRRYAELVGLKNPFTILDTDDQLRILKQLLEADGIDTKRWPPRMLASQIDGWKNRGLGPDRVPGDEGYQFANGRGIDLYAAYQARLKELNAVDFGDLLLLSLDLFRDHPDVLQEYQRKFRYIMVDEYQDTNMAQYMWLRLLAQSHKNICCVGDEDQSIYGWRGAEIGNILRFEKDFEGAHIVRLERNYRSTSHILGAASGLIATNASRLGKTLYTEDNEGDPIAVQGTWDGEEEARLIGEQVEDFQREGHSLDQMAVLVRAGFQTRAFEDRFLTLGLNYRVIGGAKFYERQEIRDALAYLRVVNQPADDLAFERIINKPRRGIGQKTLQSLYATARAKQIPLTGAVYAMLDDNLLKGKARTSLSELMADLERWRSMARSDSHILLTETILDESGYTKMWQNDKSPDAPGRLENLVELVDAMDQFENLQGFLEHVALVMDNEDADDGEKISLMTLHAAKGLEFDIVFLPGWEEGLFPSQRSMDENGTAGLEEERRLAYVGITRARKHAMICFAANRFVHGQWISAIPSRFIDEIPPDHVEVRAADGTFGQGEMMPPSFAGADKRGFDSAYETPGWQRARRHQEWDSTATTDNTRLPRSSGPNEVTRLTVSENDSDTNYELGARVFHQKFGYGRIKLIEGNKLTIAFDKAGTKKVIDRFVEPA